MFFKDIIGQEELKARLRKSVTEQRVSHAQLFSENEGYGALALAIAYAAFINCPNRSDEDACGVCPSCVKFKKYMHPDLHFIYPTVKTDDKRISQDYFQEWLAMLDDSDCYCTAADWIERLNAANKQAMIYVDEADHLLKTMHYKSYESEYKVIVIWLIEKMQYQAAPKLLKILEEPPEKTLFLLITQTPEEILSTIKSRTQLLRLPPIDEKALTEDIRNHFADVADDKIARIVHLAEGSRSKAFKLMEYDDEEKEYFHLFVDWMRTCYVADVQKALTMAESFSKMGRERQKNFFTHALQLLHFFVQYHSQGAPAVKVDEEELAFIGKFAPYVHLKNAAVYAEAFEEAITHLERNANPTILFMDISAKIMSWIAKEKRK